jgi:N-acetylmuramic acid 6-phosphate etherase
MAAVAAVRAALPAIAAAASAASARLREGGRLAYAGAGTSGRIGVQDGAELPPTFDWPEDRLVLLMAGGVAAFTRSIEGAEDDRGAGEDAIGVHDIGASDVLIGLAASGSTPFTLACVEAAAARGALTIAVANSAGAPLLSTAAFPILIETGAEAIAGSTRMKAGTAQKVVLTLLSTLIMLELGRIYRGQMVDMNARNEKLRGRATRMVMRLAGCDETQATAALAQAGGRVKQAVLIAGGMSHTAAEALLAQCGGRLRAALSARS